MNSRFAMISILLTMVALFATVNISAQNRAGREIDIKIYFPYDESHIDSTYMANGDNLRLIDSLLKDSAYISTISKIEVSAQSSPEGRVSYNESLSKRRKESLQKYFTSKYPHTDSQLWSFSAMAENWELFHQHLVEDENLPLREQILAISESDKEPDSKEWLLKNLDDGRAWSYIKEQILPSQRFGASVLFIPITYTPIARRQTKVESNLATQQFMVAMPSTSIAMAGDDIESKLLIALKTNLVLDALSVINIGVEVPIGERWSVVGEIVYPWWRSWEQNFTMQIESYHAEVKYWLGDRSTKEQLQGWSVGAYGGWGLYDIQIFSEDGVQGDFYDVGAQLCYSHPIAKNLNLEYTLGLGYVSTNYNDYNMAYDTEEFGDIKVIPYPWMNNTLRSILPTRLGISLVWHIKSSTEGGKR